MVFQLALGNWQLAIRAVLVQVRERQRLVIAGLGLELGKVDGLAVEAGRGAGLQAAEVQAQFCQATRQPARRGFADAAAFGLALTCVHQAAQERAGTDDDGAAGEVRAVGQTDARYATDGRVSRRSSGDRVGLRSRKRRPRCGRGMVADGWGDGGRVGWGGAIDFLQSEIQNPRSAIFNDNLRDFAADDGDVRTQAQQPLHLDGVLVLVGLGAGTPDGRALGAVEHAELDAGGVDRQAHQAAEGVDLADHLPLGEPADRGVAGHLPGAGRVEGDERDARVHPPGGPSRFGPGVSAADDDDVEVLGHIGDQSFL